MKCQYIIWTQVTLALKFVSKMDFFYLNLIQYKIKTRRGSPVDDRPSTDELHQFVKKKKNM